MYNCVTPRTNWNYLYETFYVVMMYLYENATERRKNIYKTSIGLLVIFQIVYHLMRVWKSCEIRFARGISTRNDNNLSQMGVGGKKVITHIFIF